MERFLRFLKKIIPSCLFNFLRPAYHWLLALSGAVFYRFPSSSLKVIGITGTSGKTTTAEMLYQIFTAAGFKAASLSGLYFRVGGEFRHNKLKMTMPGRWLIQKFLREAKDAGCEYVFLEVTSEGIKQSRHRFIKFYAAIFTNLSPEHIESHGGFENYRAAKGKLFAAATVHVLNKSDGNFEFFNKIPAREKIFFRADDFPADWALMLGGKFNRENAAAALAFSRREGISDEIVKKELADFSLPGRMEFVKTGKGFKVLVDYSFLPQTLEKVYQTLNPKPSALSNLICVLGAAGGGRDRWKRPVLGEVAAKYCREIIVTNEDPYDENPQEIMKEVENGIKESENYKLQTINLPGRQAGYKLVLDRREAVREALKIARLGDTVVITGKGAEPWIMGPGGTRQAWDDREIVREELQNL